MSTDRPTWAQRIAKERAARGMSQQEAVETLRAHAPTELVAGASLLRQWKRWEAQAQAQEQHGGSVEGPVELRGAWLGLSAPGQGVDIAAHQARACIPRRLNG